MAEQGKSVSKSQMSARERESRSRIMQLLRQAGLVRGNLILRRRLCGKPNCKCARGQRHEGLFLQASINGRPRQIQVPRCLEQQVRQWVEDYHRVREHLEEISQVYWQKIIEGPDRT